MPDSFEHTPALTMRMPNGALASLAGNVGPGHDVAVADLILVQDRVVPTVERLMHEFRPRLVGLSVMTFQRRTALRLVRLLRSIDPSLTIVAGGYDPSLAPEAYESPDSGIDYIVRGEGELTFRALLRAIEDGKDVAAIPGLSYRRPGLTAGFVHNPAREVSKLDAEIALPNRAARVLNGYTFMGRGIDIVETSRGCTYDCSFCSIIEMRGRNFHTFDFTRVLADIADARNRGARAIFIVDDNITLNVARFEALCHAIVDAGFDDVHYIVQAMTSSIANHGETLAPLMRRAGFRYVFLGIENVLDEDLQFLRASAKNAQRENGKRTGNATLRAIERLHDAGIAVVGGIIVGNPDDTRASIETNLAFARRYVDWPYIQHPTPYPGTPMTVDFRAAQPDRQRTRRGVRRDDRGGEDRAPRGRRSRVPALAGRALDEAPARPLRAAVLHLVRPQAHAGDVRAHVPAAARGDRCWGWRASARCSGVTNRSAPASASTCRRCPQPTPSRRPRINRRSAVGQPATGYGPRPALSISPATLARATARNGRRAHGCVPSTARSAASP